MIDGGNLDINFVVSDPDRHPVVMEPRSMDGLHGLDVKKTGEYEICLDNSFSTMSGNAAFLPLPPPLTLLFLICTSLFLPSPDKLLFLDIIIEDDAGEEGEEEQIVPYQLTKEALALDVQVQDMKVTLYVLHLLNSDALYGLKLEL